MSSEDDANYSDVSLDEEDEELIWRVFYSALERGNDSIDASQNTSDNNDYSDDTNDNNDDDEISDLSDIDDPELIAKYKSLKNMKINTNLTEEEKQRLIISNLTDDQMDRFEAYRRMNVNKPGVKKVCNGVLGHSIPQNIAVVLAGISKSFLSEIITRAFEVQERDFKAKLILDIDKKKKQKREILKSLEKGKEVEVDDKKLQYKGDEKSPIQPHHIREAWRLYKLESGGVFNPQWRREGDANGKMFR